MSESWMLTLFGSIWFLAIAIGIGLAWRKGRRRRNPMLVYVVVNNRYDKTILGIYLSRLSANQCAGIERHRIIEQWSLSA